MKFFSFALFSEAAATGAELLWRTKSNHVLPVTERLGDGSYLSHVQANDDRRRLEPYPRPLRTDEVGDDRRQGLEIGGFHPLLLAVWRGTLGAGMLAREHQRAEQPPGRERHHREDGELHHE